MSRLGAMRRKSEAAPKHAMDASADGADAGPHNGVFLGELMVTERLITKAQLAEALMAQKSGDRRRLGTVLVELGAISDRALAESLASQFDIPLVDLRQEQPDDEALAAVPEEVARRHLAAPLAIEDGSLVIAIADPTPLHVKSLTAAVSMPLTLVVAPADEIQRTLDRNYSAIDDIDTQVEAFQAASAAATTRARGGATAAQDDLIDSAPVVQIVLKIITQALRDRASDVHIEPQDRELRIRYRVDGALHDALTLPGEMGPGIVSRLKIMAGMNIVERRRPQDGQVAMTIDGRDIDIRVATTGTIWGEKTVLRLLDKSRSLYKLGELGFPSRTHEDFSRMIRAPFGMVLCAGPTGSGKTTTLYAALSEINEPHRNIMTIEDPVEYVFAKINQIQTNEQAGLTFATGLKSILRQDPDVILVGEIRDVETARIATQSALTGHLVLSSLHATDAVAALHRFLDMGIESFLVASSVLGVVGQRLVRKTCTYCKKPVKLTIEELGFLGESGVEPKSRYYAGEGCTFCSGTGFSDRIGVYELLKMTPEIKRLVVGWATQDEIRKMAVKQGMRSLRDEAVALVQHDVTTVAEVLRTVYTA